jgi:hypothetical protein
VAASYAMIEDHFDSAIGLTEVLFDYVLRVLETFGRDFMADHSAAFIQQLMRLSKQRDEIVKRMKAMKK